MFEVITVWDLSALIFKVLFYLAVCASIGGLATVALGGQAPRVVRVNARYAIFGSGAGLVFIWLQFIQQVGAFNEEGLAGIFDREIALMLLGSNVGIGSILRSTAIIFLLVAAIRAYYRPLENKIWAGLAVLGTILLALSFSLIGHVADLATLAVAAITVHIMAIAWWLGSLVPLLRATKLLDVADTQQLMERFGRAATVVIATLLVSGGYLIVQLVGSVERVITTHYGQVLSIKLCLVVIMLGLGALNKIRLVPNLTLPQGVKKLTRAIKVEMLLAMTILSVTAYFTTIIGPDY